jgi:asparagine synthase (glutamine-hydrolysing)
VSGLALVADLEGRPVDPGALRVLLEAQRHRGPDGFAITNCGFATLGHLEFTTTPAVAGERQPSSHEGIVVAFDGRLDDRDDVVRQLELARQPEMSDARLVLLAYRQWGAEAFRRVVGSYAAILVEPAERRLLLVRDALGVKTLFYAIAGTRLYVASEDSALVGVQELRGGVDELDEERVVRFLAVEPGRAGSTFFRHIREVPAAHLAAFELGSREPRLERYWEAGQTGPSTRGVSTDEAWGDLFRETLDASVRSAMRAPSTPAVMLSGGLDSGAVAALASRRLAQSGVPPPRAFSWIFDELSDCDERHYLAAQQRKWGMEIVSVPGDALGPLSEREPYLLTPARPCANAFRPLKQHLYRRAAGAGERVLLSGAFGDAMYLGADRGWLRGALKDRRYGLALAESWGYLARGERWALRRGLAGLLRPDRPFHRLRALERWPWLQPEALRWVEDTSTSRVDRHREALVGARSAQSASGEDEFAAREGIELRDPYRDRRLVELALVVPEHLLFRRGTFKHILRRSLHEDLPLEVRDRRSISTLLPLFVRGLIEAEPQAQRILQQRELWTRFVRRDWMARAWRELPRGGLRATETVALWATLAFALWCEGFPG